MRRIAAVDGKGEPDDTVLGRVVGGPPGKADEPAEGRAVDDRAASLGTHLGELVLHARPHTAQVHGVDTFEHLDGFVGGIAGLHHDAGVVEGHVESPERSHRVADERRNAGLVGDVAADPDRLVSFGDERVGRSGDGVGVDVSECDGSARSGECFGR